MTPVIRLMLPQDIPALADIERESFPEPHWDSQSFLQYGCIVAEVDSLIAGFLVSREIFPGSQDGLAEREILNLAVARRYRRSGVATALIRQELMSPGIHFLEVRESNTAARKLYQKLGFLEIGQRPGYYDFPRETAIVMQMK